MPATPPDEPYAETPGAVQFEVETTARRCDTAPWRRLWYAGGIIHRPLTGRQKLWRVAGLALTLALVAALLFGQQIATFAASAWAAAFPRPPAAAPMCLVDGAWSPTGRQLAILGYQGECGASGRLAGAVNLYDGSGRVRQRQIALAPLLAPAEKTLARNVDTDHIELGQLAWFAGGNRLAVTFMLPPRSDIGETTTQYGIVVFDPTGADPRMLVRFYEVADLPGSAYPLPDTGVIWDFVTGQATVLSGALTFEFWNNPLPLAYQYIWSNTDGLVPDTGVGGEQEALPIGTPLGGASFQFWQSGSLTTLQQTELPYATGDAQALFQTTFVAVSPDGRFVMAPLTMRSPVSPQLAGMNPPSPEDRGAPPILQARDAALAGIVRQIPPSAQAQSANSSGIAIAWRPDGAALATLKPGKNQQVNLYDCATGRLLRSVSTPAQPMPFQGTLSGLRWSPDGRHLLLPNGAILAI